MTENSTAIQRCGACKRDLPSASELNWWGCECGVRYKARRKRGWPVLAWFPDNSKALKGEENMPVAGSLTMEALKHALPAFDDFTTLEGLLKEFEVRFSFDKYHKEYYIWLYRDGEKVTKVVGDDLGLVIRMVRDSL